MACVVPGCKSVTSMLKDKDCELSFHRFPVNPELKNKWTRNIRKPKWKPSKFSRICSLHFESSCCRKGTQRKFLHSYAVPTIFPNQPAYTHKKIPRMRMVATRVTDSTVPICSSSMRFKSATKLTITKETAEGQNRKMTEEQVTDSVKKEIQVECRACLKVLSPDNELYYIFQPWVPPWEGVENTIAEALEKIAQVQLSDMDQHSKVICDICCEKLHSASLFVTLVQQSDNTLQQRYKQTEQNGSDNSKDNTWPKPIQVDKIVPMDDSNGVEVKQEVLSDDDNDNGCYENGVTHNMDQEDHSLMEIKTEPEEILPHTMNGHCRELGPGDETPDIPSLNGDDSSQDQHYANIKEEPVSDSESGGTDLSLDCMLCTKVFKSVSGLKAHVISQHSYKTVRRKAAHEVSPTKKPKLEYVCATCRRSFATSTDLMVHETCHNKSVCYGCNEKFDTFELVMQHRLTCKAVNQKEQVPVKTLEDVQRPRSANQENQLKCALCDETFSDDYYMNIHLEIHHSAPRRAATEDEMEVDALESLFTERA